MEFINQSFATDCPLESSTWHSNAEQTLLIEVSSLESASKVPSTSESIPIFNQSQSRFPFFIIQIGLYKAGTTSISQFERANNIPTLHHCIDGPGTMADRTVNCIMYHNNIENKPLFATYRHGNGRIKMDTD